MSLTGLAVWWAILFALTVERATLTVERVALTVERDVILSALPMTAYKRWALREKNISNYFSTTLHGYCIPRY